jgi:hypothetical protein
MTRRTNVFGQPLSYDVGVIYVDKTPFKQSELIKEGDDVSQTTKDTVVKYVQDLTHGVEGGPSNTNEFPVSGQPSELKLETTDGNTPPLSVFTNSDGQYIEPFTRMGRQLESYTNSALAEENPETPMLTTPGDASFIKKGKSSDGEISGNRVLSNGTDGLPASQVDDQYVSPILKNNRFSSNKKLSSINGHDKKFNPEHPPEGFGSYRQYSNVGTDLPDGVIAEVGSMLSLRATKELNSISRTGYGKDGPDGTGAKAASLLPGLAQVGIAKVSTDDLQVDSVLQALIAGGAEPVNIDAGSSGPRTVIDFKTSYGQMNNVLEQFSGLLPLGMIAAATAMSIALNLALRAILSVFLLITNASNSNSKKRDEIGRYIPGDSRYNPAFQKISFPPIPLPAKLFGLQETVNPYGDAVNEGIKVFFGGNVGSSLTRILESPGFYVTFSRSIVRSAADLALILEDVGRGNPIQIAENVIGFINAIKSSKVVAVMNMFAQIGDVSLTQVERTKRFGKENENSINDSEIDNLEGLDAMKARKNGSLTTAWGASTTPSYLIIPSIPASAMLSAKVGSLGNFLGNRTAIDYSTKNRISTVEVENLEKKLDAEYLPFYFHDLRTNEIISFQAFLANLSEDFSANYDNVEGYGRIDTIKLYRNTQRKIGIQFYVAATNQEDFDAMWLKFNKLITLMYPQWSKGTQLNPDGKRFIQPFSQTPSASPLCRVRVGDLWTSNYSKFSLARIFGLGSDDTFKLDKFTNKSQANVTSFEKDVQTVIERITNNNLILPDASIWQLEPGDYEASPQNQGALGSAISAISNVASSVGVKTPTNARIVAKLRVPTKVIIIKGINANAYAVNIFSGDEENLPDNIKNASFLVSRSHLSFCNQTFASLGVKESQTQDDPLNHNESVEKVVNLSQFFSADNNAVVKGFEAAKGRGIACVIENMSLDWNNVPWETAVAGSRAPKMCKITLQMAVIHDIAPGIDSNGFNRAPVYSVGRQSNAMAGNDPESPDTSNFTNNLKKIRKSLV